jgi:hypothetical protein
MLAIRGNMGQCKSEDQDLKRTWDNASLRAKILREAKENMGQCKSKERDVKE